MEWAASVLLAASAAEEADPDPVLVLAVAAGVMMVGLLVSVFLVRRMLHIAAPGQMLVVSGRQTVGPDGRPVGYRMVFGPGRVMCLPFLERVDVVDLTPFRVTAAPRDAVARGGRPAFVRAAVTVGISRDRTIAGKAVERFLGRPRDEVARTAQDTLEGVLRGFVAECDPEARGPLDERRRAQLEDACREECGKLGLAVDAVVVEKLSFGGGGIG